MSMTEERIAEYKAQLLGQLQKHRGVENAVVRWALLDELGWPPELERAMRDWAAELCAEDFPVCTSERHGYWYAASGEEAKMATAPLEARQRALGVRINNIRKAWVAETYRIRGMQVPEQGILIQEMEEVT